MMSSSNRSIRTPGHPTAFVLMAAFMLATFSPTDAATLRVPKDHKTIQDAINAAESGDTVLVQSGTYKQRLTMKPGVTLKSAGDDTTGKLGLKRAESTIIDGSGKDGKGPGITMAEGFRGFGLDPARIGELALDPAQLLGFVEVHIEQGPQLEAHGLPVGTVSAITGIERHQVTVTGKAGHAGTTPMALRDDALVKAAQIVGWLDEACRESRELVGVVGKLTVEPNAVNVIPGRVQLTVELRSPQVSLRREAWRALEERLGALRGVSHEAVYAQAGIDCDAALSERLGRAIADVGVDSLSLFSGAGHDGLAMARVAPCAMLFVRCRDGLSHHPDESVSAADCGVAMAVLERFISTLAGKSGTLDCR